MADIFDEINEELKHDQVSAVVKRYLPHMIMFVIVIAALVGGFIYYTSYKQARQEAEGSKYYDIMQSIAGEKYSSALDDLAEFSAKEGSGATELGALLHAELLLDSPDKSEAMVEFEKVSNTARNEVVSDLALLHLFALKIQDGSADDKLLSKVKPLMGLSRPYNATASLLVGLFYIENNNKEEARKVLAKLAESQYHSQNLKDRARELLASAE